MACGIGVLPGAPARAAAPPATATLTLFADQPSVTAGTRVRLSGVLRSTTPGGVVFPVAGETVEIDDLATAGQDGIEAVTRTDGSYAVTTPVRESAVFQAGLVLDGEEVRSSRARVRVLARAVLHDFKVAYSPARKVKASGRLTLGAGDGDPAAMSVALQYSPDGRRKWRTVTSGRPGRQGALRFGPFTHAPGWWRLRFAGGERFAPSVSAVRKAWRWKTSFGGVSFTPRRLKVGKKVTVTGVLYRTGPKSPKRRPYPRQKLAVIFFCAGSWRIAATGRTDAEGRFRFKAGTWCDARYQVVFDGTAQGDTLRAYSKPVEINTTGRPALP